LNFFIIVLFFFAKALTAQDNSKSPAKNDPNKDFVLNYLKSFDRFISNPDSFFYNGQRVIQSFERNNARSFYNFLSAKRYSKGNITPDSLYKHIVTYYPDGLGMVYDPTKLELVGKKKNFASSIYGYKIPLEYSGIRTDGSLLSYTDNQYIYIKSFANPKSKSIKITRVASESYQNKSFNRKIFRQGLLVEPSISTSGYEEQQHLIFRDSNTEYWFYTTDFFLNYGANLVFMFRPFWGVGVGFHTLNEAPKISFVSNGYEMNEIAGYTPIVLGSYTHRIITSSYTTPVFTRLQFGWVNFSIAFDAGVGIIYKPRYESILDGNINYHGISMNTGELVTSHPTLGFGSYRYNSELVNLYQSDKNQQYLFGKISLHFQPSKYFYVSLSGSYRAMFKLDYNEQWHMFDMYALRLKDINHPTWSSLSREISIGFNINNMFF
jgi:hypothetical protein